jgi:uncharacterized integral membrane protein (TIGR00697 family)
VTAPPPATVDVRGRVLIWLTGGFITCLLIANLTGSKFFFLDLFTIQVLDGSFTFVSHSVGMIAFPVVFLLTDLVNEYYGAKEARRMTWLAAAMSLLASGLVYLARVIPADVNSPVPQPAFDAVFGQSNRLLLASLVAFVIGQVCDIWIFGRLKRLTGGRLVWLRATGSTVVSQALDTVLVTSILFWGTVRAEDGLVWTLPQILKICATGYVLKFLLALALTPLIYLGRWFVRARFGLSPLPAA